jgi:3-deoxy-7-phosphoheptulonate synthase
VSHSGISPLYCFNLAHKVKALDDLLAHKRSPEHRTEIVITPNVSCGGNRLMLVAGPCAVESEEQMQECGDVLSKAPVQALRGGVFKPRTSPYTFQGMGEEGLQILSETGKQHGMPVIAEVMSAKQLEEAYDSLDVLQIGSRNMQNFELLKEVSQVRKPVLLKRGLAATIEEFLMAAEYIMAGGNHNVILCERGIRSFDSMTRNVLDLGAVAVLKQMTHLPVIVDPSHAAGRCELIAECHPTPKKSISDARQALSLQEMSELVKSLAAVAAAIGREVSVPSPEAVLS